MGNCVYCSYVHKFAKDSEVRHRNSVKKLLTKCIILEQNGSESAAANRWLEKTFLKLSRTLKSIYGMEVSLITSGFAFDQKRLDNLAKYDVHTAVSIDGDKEANDTIRGKGSYDKAIFAMKKLSEKGLLDCIVTTMTKYNINSLEHTCELAANTAAKWSFTTISCQLEGQAITCLI